MALTDAGQNITLFLANIIHLTNLLSREVGKTESLEVARLVPSIDARQLRSKRYRSQWGVNVEAVGTESLSASYNLFVAYERALVVA